uniref:Uncharacterized protein n=1 Tax=Haplochromis burtoni TaxID=8153 RepID=A0A3Q2VPI6_HAPBU
MSVEVDVLLQEAKESIEAAQNYRSELQQRLHGLNQALLSLSVSLHPLTLKDSCRPRRCDLSSLLTQKNPGRVNSPPSLPLCYLFLPPAV